MLRSIKLAQRLPRMIAVSITGGASPALGEGKNLVTISRAGAGDYTITPVTAFQRAPIVTHGCLTDGQICQVASVSTTAIRVKLKDAATGVAADGNLHLAILGFDAADQI